MLGDFSNFFNIFKMTLELLLLLLYYLNQVFHHFLMINKSLDSNRIERLKLMKNLMMINSIKSSQIGNVFNGFERFFTHRRFVTFSGSVSINSAA